VEAFTWDESFETHLGAVDSQHHRLVDLINDLGNLLADPAGPPPAELTRVHGELVAYAGYHFAEEERLMAEAEVDGRHRWSHQREHREFRRHVLAVASAEVEPSGAQERYLLTFLVHWLSYHILGVDQAMARQIQAIDSGLSPAQAFDREVEGQDKASRLLLGSVGALFEVLADRNQELLVLSQSLDKRVRERTGALESANGELRDLVAKVERMARTDSLTGLPNRLHAMSRLSSAFAAAVRHGRALGCLLVDSDDFKQVNDTAGHEAGDTVLKSVAEALRGAVREGDEVCRLGGDEFLVVCPETTLEGALSLGERLRAAVAGLRVEVPGGEWKGSISVGAATLLPTMERYEDLYRAADAAVYAAKRRGRNCVAGAEG
jgi:diguanylate cyclase (GGDEF)-like protein/hemerythrin-like metal-binding protein